MFHFISTLARPAGAMVGEEIAGSWLRVLLNGRQIYNTWKKQLGQGLRQLQSKEINSRNETGKAWGRHELWAGVQRLRCQGAAAVSCPAPDGLQILSAPRLGSRFRGAHAIQSVPKHAGWNVTRTQRY